MKKNFLILLAITSVISLESCKRKPKDEPVKPTETVTIKMTADNGKDANICDQASLHGSNYSTLKYLVAQSWTNGGSNQDQFILVDFDLSSIPSGATITGATLKLYSDTTRTINGSPGKGHSANAGDNRAYLRRITSPWQENTVSYDNKPTTDNVGEVIIPSTTSNDQAYSVDVTALVKTEFGNENTYQGFMIGMVNPDSYRQVVFYSSECEFAALTPELKVTFTR